MKKLTNFLVIFIALVFLGGCSFLGGSDDDIPTKASSGVVTLNGNFASSAISAMGETLAIPNAIPAFAKTKAIKRAKNAVTYEYLALVMINPEALFSLLFGNEAAGECAIIYSVLSADKIVEGKLPFTLEACASTTYSIFGVGGINVSQSIFDVVFMISGVDAFQFASATELDLGDLLYDPASGTISIGNTDALAALGQNAVSALGESYTLDDDIPGEYSYQMFTSEDTKIEEGKAVILKCDDKLVMYDVNNNELMELDFTLIADNVGESKSFIENSISANCTEYLTENILINFDPQNTYKITDSATGETTNSTPFIVAKRASFKEMIGSGCKEKSFEALGEDEGSFEWVAYSKKDTSMTCAAALEKDAGDIDTDNEITIDVPLDKMWGWIDECPEMTTTYDYYYEETEYVDYSLSQDQIEAVLKLHGVRIVEGQNPQIKVSSADGDVTVKFGDIEEVITLEQSYMDMSGHASSGADATYAYEIWVNVWEEIYGGKAGSFYFDVGIDLSNSEKIWSCSGEHIVNVWGSTDAKQLAEVLGEDPPPEALSGEDEYVFTNVVADYGGDCSNSTLPDGIAWFMNEAADRMNDVFEATYDRVNGTIKFADCDGNELVVDTGTFSESWKDSDGYGIWDSAYDYTSGYYSFYFDYYGVDSSSYLSLYWDDYDPSTWDSSYGYYYDDDYCYVSIYNYEWADQSCYSTDSYGSADDYYDDYYDSSGTVYDDAAGGGESGLRELSMTISADSCPMTSDYYSSCETGDFFTDSQKEGLFGSSTMPDNIIASFIADFDFSYVANIELKTSDGHVLFGDDEFLDCSFSTYCYFDKYIGDVSIYGNFYFDPYSYTDIYVSGWVGEGSKSGWDAYFSASYNTY